MPKELQCAASKRGKYLAKSRMSMGNSITQRTIGGLGILVGLSLFCYSQQVHAQQFALDAPILDHFDDPQGGLSPVWSALPNAMAGIDSNGGGLLIDRTGEINEGVAYVEVANTMLVNVSIRTQTRLVNEDWFYEDSDFNIDFDFGPAVTLAARTCFETIEHVCGGNPNEWIYLDFYANGEAHTSQNASKNNRELIRTTDMRPMEEDVVLQLDAFDGEVNIWVWRPGEPRPERPLRRYTERSQPAFIEGAVMFGTVHADALFRYVHVSDSPIVDLPGDFNSDWTLTVDDVDRLMTAIRTGEGVSLQDLNRDQDVDVKDLRVWVNEIRQTWFGDANLDDQFDSSDFVAVFNAGKYESGQAATWSEGDWNADGLFDSGDLIIAFEDGGFEQGRRRMAHTVPEPNSLIFLAAAFVMAVCRGKR